MAQGAPPPRKSSFRVSTIPLLASWQLRETWFLLLYTAIGMVAAVVIVCTIPLLYNVMTTAGLRQTLHATPYSSDIEADAQTDGLSAQVVQAVQSKFDDLLYSNVGNAVTPTLSALTSDDFSFYPTQ